MVDTAADKYYSVSETGDQLILPYDEKPVAVKLKSKTALLTVA
jgi:hypothetical protein